MSLENESKKNSIYHISREKMHLLPKGIGISRWPHGKKIILNPFFISHTKVSSDVEELILKSRETVQVLQITLGNKREFLFNLGRGYSPNYDSQFRRKRVESDTFNNTQFSKIEWQNKHHKQNKNQVTN
jgi:uncharacterized membrane protein